MILLDCGNSSAKAQYRADGRLAASFATRYSGDWGARLADWLQDRPASHCWLASVLDAGRRQTLESVLGARFGDAVTRCRSEAECCGVINGYDEPARLGVDRWLALLGAAALIDGDWGEDEFLIVSPGQSISPSNDPAILKAVPTA